MKAASASTQNTHRRLGRRGPSEATVENSVTGPQKLITEAPCDLAVPLLSMNPEELKAGTQIDTVHW